MANTSTCKTRHISIGNEPAKIAFSEWFLIKKHVTAASPSIILLIDSSKLKLADGFPPYSI